MHELSIAMRILDLLEEEAPRLDGRKISAVHLKLGQFSGVVKEALLNSYELASEQTSFQGTRLVIEEVPIAMQCPQCGERRLVKSPQLLCCQQCGTPASDILEGKEIQVFALELCA